MAGDISTVEQNGAPQTEQHRAVTMLQSIREKVEATPFFPKGMRQSLVDPKKAKPLIKDVVLELEKAGFNYAHRDDVLGLYTLACYDLRLASTKDHVAHSERLLMPEGRVFFILDSAIDEVFPLRALMQDKGSVNQAVSREVDKAYNQVQFEVLESKGLTETVKVPADIPDAEKQEIQNRYLAKVTTLRDTIAKNPVAYATGILQRDMAQKVA